MYKFVFYSTGGLANRLNSIVSLLEIALSSGKGVCIVDDITNGNGKYIINYNDIFEIDSV